MFSLASPFSPFSMKVSKRTKAADRKWLWRADPSVRGSDLPADIRRWVGAVHAVPAHAAACPWARVCTHTRLCAGRRTTAVPWPINTYVREQCRGPVLMFWAQIPPWFVWERCGSKLGSICCSCAAFRVRLLFNGACLHVLFSAPVPTDELWGGSELFFWFAAGCGAGNDSLLVVSAP